LKLTLHTEDTIWVIPYSLIFEKQSYSRPIWLSIENDCNAGFCWDCIWLQIAETPPRIG
jgi:hypothetical protein